MPIWSHPIWEAYQSHGDVEQLKLDILTTPWYRPPSTVDESLLVRAVCSCDLRAAKLLMELGESPALPTDDGFTLLHLAVDNENEKSTKSLELIEALLEHGADPNVQGMDGTPLHRAAGAGQIAVAQMLLKHGADLNARTLADGEVTPLTHAMLMNQPEMVRYLSSVGAVH